MKEKGYIHKYVSNLILADGKLNPPDRTRTNGEFDALQTAYEIHQRDGSQAAKIALEAIVDDYPTIADALAGKAEKSAFTLHHEDDLALLPPPSWLIDQRLVRGGLNILYGASGSGKSFYALHLAKQANETAIYVAGEGSSGYQSRIAAYNQHHNITKSKLHFIFDTLNMLDPASVDILIETLREYQPGLVVLDTLARCMVGGDENSAKDIGLVIANIGKIQKELNTTILLVHHTGKNGASERGSSALRGAADAMMHLDNDGSRIRLQCTKMKDAPEFETEYFKLLPVEGTDSVVIVPSDKIIENDNFLSPHEKTIIEVLGDSDVFDQGARTGDLQKASEIPSGSFFRVLRSLSRRKLIVKEGKYDPWVLSTKGHKIGVALGLIPQPAITVVNSSAGG